MIDNLSKYLILEHIKDIVVSHSRYARENDMPYLQVGNKKEIYAKVCLSKNLSVVDGIRELKMILHYYSNEPVPKNMGIFLDEHYMAYHINNFIIKMNTVIDCIILLINHVLLLGTPEKKCSIYTLKENTVVKDLSVIKQIVSLHAHYISFKADRNIIIHKGENIETSKNLNEFIALSRVEEHVINDIDPDFEAYYLPEVDKLTKTTGDMFKDQIEFLEAQYHLIIDELLPIVKNKIVLMENE